jgi:hypothetical protein
MTRERWRTPASTFEHVLHPSTRRTYHGLPELGDHSDSRGGDQPGQRLDCSRLVVTPAETTSTPAAGTSSSPRWTRPTRRCHCSKAGSARRPGTHRRPSSPDILRCTAPKPSSPGEVERRCSGPPVPCHPPAHRACPRQRRVRRDHRSHRRPPAPAPRRAHRQRRTRHRSLVRNSTHCCRPVRQPDCVDRSRSLSRHSKPISVQHAHLVEALAVSTAPRRSSYSTSVDRWPCTCARSM